MKNGRFLNKSLSFLYSKKVFQKFSRLEKDLTFAVYQEVARKLLQLAFMSQPLF